MRCLSQHESRAEGAASKRTMGEYRKRLKSGSVVAHIRTESGRSCLLGKRSRLGRASRLPGQACLGRLKPRTQSRLESQQDTWSQRGKIAEEDRTPLCPLDRSIQRGKFCIALYFSSQFPGHTLPRGTASRATNQAHRMCLPRKWMEWPWPERICGLLGTVQSIVACSEPQPIEIHRTARSCTERGSLPRRNQQTSTRRTC